MGSKAFVPGHLVHTNEVTVFLGDQYFLQCTASHAVDIVNRRLASEWGDGLVVSLEAMNEV